MPNHSGPRSLDLKKQPKDIIVPAAGADIRSRLETDRENVEYGKTLLDQYKTTAGATFQANNPVFREGFICLIIDEILSSEPGEALTIQEVFQEIKRYVSKDLFALFENDKTLYEAYLQAWECVQIRLADTSTTKNGVDILAPGVGPTRELPAQTDEARELLRTSMKALLGERA